MLYNATADNYNIQTNWFFILSIIVYNMLSVYPIYIPRWKWIRGNPYIYLRNQLES